MKIVRRMMNLPIVLRDIFENRDLYHDAPYNSMQPFNFKKQYRRNFLSKLFIQMINYKADEYTSFRKRYFLILKINIDSYGHKVMNSMQVFNLYNKEGILKTNLRWGSQFMYFFRDNEKQIVYDSFETVKLEIQRIKKAVPLFD